MTQQPLTSWNCDTCGDDITDPDRALVVWRKNKDLQIEDFRIVHKSMDGRTCDPGARNGYTSNLELSTFLGHEGLALLLSWLSRGPVDGATGRNSVLNFDQYVDLVRRVQTPWYEQARPKFRDEDTQHWLGDANEIYPYLPGTLRRTALGQLGS